MGGLSPLSALYLKRERAQAHVDSYTVESGLNIVALYSTETAQQLQRDLAAANAEIERLTCTLTAANAVIESQNKNLEELRTRKFARFNNEECWIYQGDGNDHLESLICPVVISAQRLLEADAEIDAQSKAYGLLVMQLEHARERYAKLCEWLPFGTGFEGRTFAEAIRGVGLGGSLAAGFDATTAPAKGGA